MLLVHGCQSREEVGTQLLSNFQTLAMRAEHHGGSSPLAKFLVLTADTWLLALAPSVMARAAGAHLSG